ncbi:MAG TPA: hypothetical protein ENK72_02390 [Epsilonproteobacteria bacterium]|nr:hypothetical protein [Campylobacterota bacterium]
MILAIAGGTGSGKTTVARSLSKMYADSREYKVLTVSMDSYYKNIHEEAFDNYDHPEAFDMGLLHSDLEGFQNHSSMPLRRYSYQTKERDVTGEVKQVDLLILEGLYPFFDPKVRAMCDWKIYLDIEEKIRLKRRVTRDIEERGITVEENMTMIHGFVKKMHQRYVSLQKQHADRVYHTHEKVENLTIAY